MVGFVELIQGKTGNNSYDIPANLTKGLLGGLTVYLLSETSSTEGTFTIAFGAGMALNLTQKWSLKHGVTPFGRGVQIGAALYVASTGQYLMASLSLLHPMIFSGFAFYEGTCLDGGLNGGLDSVLEVWGVKTPQEGERWRPLPSL